MWPITKMDELRSVPLHRALTRPQLFAGGEREPMLLLILVCFSLIFIGLSWFTVLGAFVFYFFGVLILRLMAKRDPLMSGIYRRHVGYRRFYAARPTVFGPQSSTRPWR